MPKEERLTRKEWLETLDDDIRRMATGTQAQQKYEEVLSRIADALEHQVINSTMTLLAAPSKDFPAGRTAPLYISGHLASCGACTMLRKAEPVEVPALLRGALGNASKLIGG